jgi:hypothetical protein
VNPVAQQITPGQMRALAGQDFKAKIDAIRGQPGMGVALYTDNQGNDLVVSYGTFRAEVPSRYCPSNYGDLSLAAFVPPGSTTGTAQEEMVSPLKLAVQDSAETFPQLPTRWHYGGSVTEHPGAHGRSSPVTIPPEVLPNRAEILGERPPAPPPQPAADSEAAEAAAWWDRHLPRR